MRCDETAVRDTPSHEDTRRIELLLTWPPLLRQPSTWARGTPGTASRHSSGQLPDLWSSNLAGGPSLLFVAGVTAAAVAGAAVFALWNRYRSRSSRSRAPTSLGPHKRSRRTEPWSFFGPAEQYQQVRCVSPQQHRGFLWTRGGPNCGVWARLLWPPDARQPHARTMAAVGFDFGNFKSVVAVARNRGIDIITNEISNRFTPYATVPDTADGEGRYGSPIASAALGAYAPVMPRSMVGFTSKERLLGEAAKTQVRLRCYCHQSPPMAPRSRPTARPTFCRGLASTNRR